VAKATGQRLTDRTLFTQFGSIVGTLEYMSPEQAELNQIDIDTRSDIYSLGVLLYELLTGSTPLTRETLRQGVFEEVLRRIREEDPPTPSARLGSSGDQLPAISAQRELEPEKLTKTVRGELDWIVMKALEKERSRRYETANGLAMDLQRYLNDEPVVAGPPTVGYRARKFVRKHRTAVAVAAGFVMLLAVASMVSTGLALWANRERKDKEEQTRRAEQKAIEESEAKEEVSRQRERADALVQELELSRIEDAFSMDKASSALAYLTRVLHDRPANTLAAQRLLFALTYRSFPLNVMERAGVEPGLTFSSADFSPDGQGILIASEEPASRSNSVRLWDARTGRPLTEPLASLDFSPDGKRVLTVSIGTNSNVLDFELRDARTGRLLVGPLSQETRGRLGYALFAPDGERLLTVGSSSFRLWDVTPRQSSAEPLVHETNARLVSAQFSLDGQRLIAVSQDSFRLWDARAGQPVADAIQRYAPRRSSRVRQLGRSIRKAPGLQAAAVSSSIQFSRDGTLLTAIGEERTVYLWDARTGSRFGEVLRHAQPVDQLQFTPDGDHLLTVTSNVVWIWDLRSVQQTPRGLTNHAAVLSVQVGLNGSRFVTYSDDGNGYLWDAARSEFVAGPFQVEPSGRSGGNLIHPTISPDGARMVLVSPENAAQVRDMSNGRLLGRPINHLPVSTAVFSPDGQWLLTKGDGSLRIFDARSGESLSELVKPGGYLFNFQLSPTRQQLLTLSQSPSIRAQVWEVGPRQALPDLVVQEATSRMLALAPVGQDMLMVFWKDNSLWLRVADGRTSRPLIGPIKPLELQQELLPRILAAGAARGEGSLFPAQLQSNTNAARQRITPRRPTFRSARLSPNGERILTVCDDGYDSQIRIWDVRTGRPQTNPILTEGTVFAAQFDKEGERISAVLLRFTNWVFNTWEATTGRQLSPPVALPAGGAIGLARISPRGNAFLATCWTNGFTNGFLDGFIVQHEHPAEDKPPDRWTQIPLCSPLVSDAEFNADGQRLYTIAWKSNTMFDVCSLWDARSGVPVNESLGHELAVLSAKFSHDGSLLVTTSMDRTARIWNSRTGLALTEPLQHQDQVLSAEFGADGKRLVTLSERGAIQVWDVRTGFPLTDPLRSGEGAVLPRRERPAARFSPDGQRVFVTLGDRLIRIWDLPIPPLPVPAWLPQLAEKVGGKRVNQQGVLEDSSDKQVRDLQRMLRETNGQSFYIEWARWFLADANSRTLSPFSSVTVPEYIQRRIEENTLESLREATLLGPTNGLAFARLAVQVLAQSDRDNPRRVGEADFYSRYALKLAPQDAEVAKIRSRIEEHIMNLPKP
jgi:WD40 repeat protein